MWVSVVVDGWGDGPTTVWVEAEAWGSTVDDPGEGAWVDGVAAIGDALRLEAESRGVRLSKQQVNRALRHIRFVDDPASNPDPI